MKYVKPIVKPGRYSVNRLDGGRGEENFTPERLAGWVKNFRDMRAAGLRVPFPFRHDRQALPTEPGASSDPTYNPEDSRHNGGFWEELYVDGSGELVGVVDVPDSHPDKDKIGTSIQEVSPLVLSDWTDGKGRKWKDAILHIAGVTHPVIPGQENFQPLAASEPLASAMSFALSNLLPTTASKSSGPTGSLATCIEALKMMGIELPPDTTAENLAERLVVACKAIAASRAGENEGPTGNAQEQPTPIVMAQAVLKAAGIQIVLPDTLPPEPPAPQPIGSVMAQSPSEIAALALLADNKKQGYKSRIEALVASGRITPAARKEHLDPLVEGFQLSLDPTTHQPVRGPLDLLLAFAESLIPATAMHGGLQQIRTTRNGRLVAATGQGFQGSHGGSLTEETLDPSLLRKVDGPALIEDEEELDKSIAAQAKQAGLRV